jgi:hypothetical protein
MRKLNTKKAHGPDDITSKEINVVTDEINYCIVNISRMSYQKYPSQWKYPIQWKIGKARYHSKQRWKSRAVWKL